MNDSALALRRLALVLAAKTLLPAAVVGALHLDAVHLTTAALALAGLVGVHRGRMWGHAALSSALLLRITSTFPHTLNHAYFELLVALVLWRASSRRGPRAAVQARVVLQFAILSVFFQSGVQKLARGEFVSGEYLLRALTFESGPMTRGLRWALDPLGPFPSFDFPALLRHPIPLSVSSELHATLVGISLVVLAAELAVPLLVVARLPGSRWLLLAMQVGIGLASGETDFALTATAAILLLWRRTPRAAWWFAFVGWMLLGIAML